ncbi:hypothetical protein Pint_11315 [Pistacia integerrima]|uniref:Uncharacterized protein n=1 Tax=Pistacia integerrima TaxID=434235 RepID=A0ACC0XJ02_9ROSI|nr:hypothetical protein Pint_11315 [Pistacia integerrima]
MSFSSNHERLCVCPTVGVVGHLRGGGCGNMLRKYGLSVDNVVDAKIVDVQGRILDKKALVERLLEENATNVACKRQFVASSPLSLSPSLKLAPPSQASSSQLNSTLSSLLAFLSSPFTQN